MPNTEHRKLAAIVFTDMVGYSALMQRDEALALDLLEEHHQLLRGILPKYQGREIKSTGDGFLLEFSSALAAAQCAVEIQRALAARNQSQSAERQVRIRIGIHVGDVVRRDNDVIGDGVNIAARIEPLAEPGGICVSRAVYEQIENKVSHPLVQLGKPRLKNIQANVEVYKLVLDGVRSQRAAKPRRWRLMIIFAIAVAVNLLLFLKFGLHSKSSTAASAPAPASNTPPAIAAVTTTVTDQQSVAVLPFANISADKENEYLSDGITEDILNALAKVPGLQVPARTSAFVFKGRNEDVRKIGALLHVATVLEGSVQRSGDQLRITAKLSNVADGYQLWSEQFDRDMKDVFAIQDEITRAIVAKLKLTLAGPTAPQTIKHGTENIEAYQLYLKGRFYAQRYTAESVKQAIACFEQAVEKQPDYAQAYVALAYAYGELLFFGQTSSKDIPARMAEVVKKARQLDTSLPETYLFEAHTSFFYKWDWPEAERLFKRAIELDQANPDAYTGYSMFLTAMGRFQEAETENTVAGKLDPLSNSVKLEQGWIYLRAKAYDRALDIGRQMSVTETNYHKVHELIGLALFRKGRRDDGLAEMEATVRLESDPLVLSRLGRMYGVAGRKDDAGRILAQLQEQAKRGYVPAHCLAQVYEGLGDFEQANSWMNKAIAAHEFPLVDLKVEADELSLANPHFTEWLKKIGLEK